MIWVDWLRSGSQLVAGLKITAAFLSYVGLGQIGRWLFEKFYPFTRLLWHDFFSWLQLPDISNLEKDALTAVLFFMPLAISSIISAYYREKVETDDQKLRSDRITAMLFGVLFFVLICGALVRKLI